MASTDLSANRAATPTEQPLIDEAELVDVPVIDAAPIIDAAPAASQPAEPAASSAETAPVNMQTIANAYRDYARKSFQENSFFVEKLMGVRSFDKAVEVQTDYARQAYANFVADSQKICGLYTELARQTFSPWKASRPGTRLQSR
ncbi:MAG: phasin family protein [Bradyrhizobium sp.]|nr:phasin family protein [Pseudomonadota bacterium]MDE2067314.1 phasin family protein [Bradyrhizobium sp.]MDE2243816.1 phasin family protein [Bradyrhizobium sp.]MDE2471935.1 phasin family protein [Bradyrhizobium sp.]